MLIHLKDSQQSKFKIQTDHGALVWLHNVKDPSSRLLRWRLRMEDHDYDIEYVKGKGNKVADCLSRIFPITSDISKQAMWEAGISDEEDGTAELKTQLQEMMEFLSNYYPHLNFHLCFTPTRELTNEEKQALIKEEHSTHLGEKNTSEKAKTIGL